MKKVAMPESSEMVALFKVVRSARRAAAESASRKKEAESSLVALMLKTGIKTFLYKGLSISVSTTVSNSLVIRGEEHATPV